MDVINGKMEIINGKRLRLAERLPLDMPYSISVTTANICNLECEFCAISEKGRSRNKNLMDKDTFQLFIDRLLEANWHLKQIVLVGLGEPLINPNIVDFVRMIKEAKVADKVHIVTNAINLTEEMTERLLEAGLDVLRVSLNGLSDEDYLKYTNRKIDFSRLIKQLEYFHEKSGNAKLYVKIMDYMVEDPNKLKYFYDAFERISTVLNVEYLTEMSTTLDYEGISKQTKKRGLKGFEIVETQRCPLPFYHIYLNAEGTISACCVAGPWSTPPALVMGDLHTERIDNIWHGENFYKLHSAMLKYGRGKANRTCEECKAYLSYIYPEDVVSDEEAERVLKILKSKRER